MLSYRGAAKVCFFMQKTPFKREKLKNYQKSVASFAQIDYTIRMIQ